MKFLAAFRDLSKAELALWVSSVASIIIPYAVWGGELLTVVASLIGVTALIFVSKGYVLGQALTVVFAVFYGIISFYFRYYGEMITYLCMTAPIAVCAVISWMRHPYKDSKEVEVHKLTVRQKLTVAVSAVLVTAVFYFILKALGNASLIISTVSITTSFAASMLTFFRSPYYAVAYAANDVVLIALWVIACVEDASYFPMVICFVMFLANDLYGFFNWRRMERRQGSHE